MWPWSNEFTFLGLNFSFVSKRDDLVTSVLLWGINFCNWMRILPASVDTSLTQFILIYFNSSLLQRTSKGWLGDFQLLYVLHITQQRFFKRIQYSVISEVQTSPSSNYWGSFGGTLALGIRFLICSKKRTNLLEAFFVIKYQRSYLSSTWPCSRRCCPSKMIECKICWRLNISAWNNCYLKKKRKNII